MPARCRIICFSPTGSTRKIAECIAGGTGLPSAVWDLTLPGTRQRVEELLPDDLVLLAAPVYYGRVQKDAAQVFGALRGQGQAAVLLVNYGNRNYDDALLELHDLAQNAGFVPVAAAAFVSEHSFSTPECPIAAGRPDPGDLQKAEEFGKALMGRLEPEVVRLALVPGNRPFKEYPDFHRAPLTSGSCTACGICVSLCPTGAVYMDADKACTREEDCIVCQACVKGCPEEARADTGPGAKETRAHLLPITAERKAPTLFL